MGMSTGNLTIYDAVLAAERATTAFLRLPRDRRTQEVSRAVNRLHGLLRVVEEGFHLEVAAIEARGLGLRATAEAAVRSAAMLHDSYQQCFTDGQRIINATFRVLAAASQEPDMPTPPPTLTTIVREALAERAASRPPVPGNVRALIGTVCDHIASAATDLSAGLGIGEAACLAADHLRTALRIPGEVPSTDVGAYIALLVAAREAADEQDRPAEHAVAALMDRMRELLLLKNEEYGNAALDPVRLFSPYPADAGIAISLDHKVSRMAKGGAKVLVEDTEVDLLGYLVLRIVGERLVQNSAPTG